MKNAIKRTREELEYSILNLELELRLLKGGRIHLEGDDLTKVDQSIDVYTNNLAMCKKKLDILKKNY